MEVFDTHAHLQEPEFREDLDAVIERARAAGITDILLPAVDLESGEAALQLASRYEGLHVALGYHPHEASRLDDEAFERLEVLLALRFPSGRAERVVAVGEIGLDFYRMHSPADVQVRVFERMLDLAAKGGLPVVVHCREAAETTEEILTSWAKSALPRIEAPVGVMHYFSHDAKAAGRYVELGFFISIHTSVTHPKAEQLRAVAAALPLDSLVIETDSPYGAPQAFRGERNEPAFVVETARTIAALKGVTTDTVAAATTANARRLFRIASSPLTASGIEA